MNKKSIITIVVLIIIIVGYYTAITSHKNKLDNYDRSILIENYNQKNYFGVVNTNEKEFYLIELDDQLAVGNKEKFGELETTEKFIDYLKINLNFQVEDSVKFDDNNQVESNNIDPKYQDDYLEIIKEQKVITKMLGGELKLYHPKYNNILARIATSIEMSDDGVITKKIVKKMIAEDISQEDINAAFVTIISPALECTDTENGCTIIEPYYTDIIKNFNAMTNHDLPTYSELSKQEE